MRIAYHFVSIAVFSLVFLLGGWMAKESAPWSAALASRSAPRGALKDAFTYSGRIFQVVAVVWAFLDVISIVILATEYLVLA
jgi:hypothetical protein